LYRDRALYTIVVYGVFCALFASINEFTRARGTMTSSKFRVGLHTSIAGGLSKSINEAVAKGCDCLQIFSRNPRGWQVRTLGEEEVKTFRDAP